MFLTSILFIHISNVSPTSSLSNYPLYEYAKETIQVLVAGFGLYGQLFLDQCLQSGQMIDKKLKVTVLYEDSVKQYLDQRPSLMDFFNGKLILHNDYESRFRGQACFDSEVYYLSDLGQYL